MKSKEVFLWSVYDFANTIFSALFVTFFFPFFVKEFLGGSEFVVGLTFGLSMLAVGLVVPFLGAWSDAVGRRMPFIVFFTILCCALTIGVAFVGLKWALVFGFLANIAYHGALTTYNALMTGLSSKKEYGLVSGVGAGMGYAGTLTSLAAAFIILSVYGWETKAGAQSIFVLTGVLFFMFSLITFFGLRERVRSKEGFFVHLSKAVRELQKTVPRLKKKFVRFLLAMFLFADAQSAIIIFLFLYGRTVFGLPVKSFLVVYTLFAVGAMLGSFFIGKWIDRYGAVRVLRWSGISWCVVLGMLAFTHSLAWFVFGGVLGGALLGIVTTAMRPQLLFMSPMRKSGEYFGFLELMDKFSGVIGPIVFGALATFVGYPAAILSLIVFFLGGLWLLKDV